MKLTINKPFLTSTGEVVTMKAVTTICDKVSMQVQEQYIEVHQHNGKYYKGELTPMSADEYNNHLAQLANEDN